MNVLLLLLPRAWRRRYGEELLDELRRRKRTPAVVLDLLALAARLRTEQLGRHFTPVLLICLPAAAGGAFGTYKAVGRLSHGWVELPGHWWSAPWPALTIGFLTTCLLASAARRRLSRR
jgi:hypothetical protein